MGPTRTVFVTLLAAIALGGCSCGTGGAGTPTITSFKCSPSNVPAGGGPVMLSWNVAAATSLSINNGIGVVNPVTVGSVTVTVTTPTTFTLTASNFDGTSTASCSVTVGLPVPTIISFTATPSTLLPGGGEVTLAWNVTNATSLSVSPAPGPVTPVTSGSVQVQVTATTTFTLTATNSNGQNTASANVTVCTAPPTINSFVPTPSSLSVGGGAVVLSWNVTCAASLSIAPNVGAVGPPDVGEVTTLVAVTTMFTLTATNSLGSTTADAGVTVAVPTDAGIIVTGTVVDDYGIPIAGETVVIESDGGTQTVVSDGDGGFSVPNVFTPYTATVVESTQAVQYQGLTRQNPSLNALLSLPQNHSSTLSGSFTGGSYPEGPSANTVFLFSSPQTTASLGNQPSGNYSVPVTWAGPSTTVGTLYALQIQSGATGLPTSYPGYGTVGVQFQDMGTLSQNIALSSVTTGTFSGAIESVPSGYTLSFVAVSLVPASGVNMAAVFDSSANTSFAYEVPSISNTEISVTAAATSAVGEFSYILQTGLSANATVTLNIPAAPTLISPANAATGVTAATPFSWTPFPSGIHEFQATPTGSGPAFYIFTASTSVDLADAGLPLPASAGYSWHVVGFAPLTTVDELAEPGGITFLTIDLSQGYSATNTFTTAP